MLRHLPSDQSSAHQVPAVDGTPERYTPEHTAIEPVTGSRIILTINTHKTRRAGELTQGDMLKALATDNPGCSIEAIDVHDLPAHLDERTRADAEPTTYAIIGGDGSIQHLGEQILHRGLESHSTLWTFREGGASEIARMCGSAAFRASNLCLAGQQTARVRPIHAELFSAAPGASWEEHKPSTPQLDIYAAYCLAAGNIAVGSARIDSKSFRETVAGKPEWRRRVEEILVGATHINMPINPGIQTVDGQPIRASSISYANGSRYGRYGRPGTTLFDPEIVRFDQSLYPPKIWLEVAQLALQRANTQVFKPGEYDVLHLTEATLLQVSGEVMAVPAGFLRVSPSEQALTFIISQEVKRKLG